MSAFHLYLSAIGLMTALSVLGCAMLARDFYKRFMTWRGATCATQEHVRRALRRRDAGFRGMRGSWSR